MDGQKDDIEFGFLKKGSLWYKGYFMLGRLTFASLTLKSASAKRLQSSEPTVTIALFTPCKLVTVYDI